ncbi:hypothetical protein F4808DRAFT_470051 [Astrocystis sublimbata]|nr:hypothetical protein F4808DRAFT_470051 [Astrocystis sublimbata]
MMPHLRVKPSVLIRQLRRLAFYRFQNEAHHTQKTIDSLDITTDSGYASQGPSQRKNQLRNTIRGTLEDSSLTADTYDDGKTEYSDARSLHRAKLEIYISEFAEELAAVLPQSISAEQLHDLSTSLPELLKAFAIKFGQEINQNTNYRLMYLVHRYRNQISKAVISAFAIEEEHTEEEVQKPIDVMPIHDKMVLWARQNNQQAEETQDRDEFEFQSDHVYDDDGMFENFPEIHEYRQTLLVSPAYSWLLKSVIIEIDLEIPVESDDARGKIRKKILKILEEPSKISQQKAPGTRPIVFNLPWIRNYLISQEYDEPIGIALPRAMVVIGSDDQSFVTTCGEYLETLWPDIGPQILGLCISLLNSSHRLVATCTLFDGTNISARVDQYGSTVEFYVIGTVYSLAEIGEIVVWLSAAFNNNSSGFRLVYRHPTCDIEHYILGWHKSKPSVISHPPKQASPYLVFTFAESAAQRKTDADPQGRCWVSLFGNRTVVNGYPIPRRAIERTGAEIQLDLMMKLVNARNISIFCGAILIKGYSAVLIPTQCTEDTIVWHLIIDELGDYVSYTDPKVKDLVNGCAKGLTRGRIEASRHMVGWCSSVLNHAGAADAKYSIGWTDLKPPNPGFAFDKVNISGGMFVQAGISAIIGKRDKAVHVNSRDDYTMRLKWISRKFVVLYDVQDRRAWLLDGISALLHLVRASLQHDLNDEFQSLCLYEEGTLKEPPDPHAGKKAAIKMLTTPHNLAIPLYAKPDSRREETTSHEGGREAKVHSRTKTNYCLKDRIEGIYHILEQIISLEADMRLQDGVGFKVRASDRRHIEGFDFMDVATEEDPCRPRQHTLRSSGRRWVDFVRAIHAITLFGTGFGDLISPSTPTTKECTSCHANMNLPKGRDLLAKRGSTATTPWRLVDEIYWHTPDKTFEPCQSGQIPQTQTKCDRVQVLLPSSFPKLWGRNFKSPSNLAQAPRGAVIFGHSRRFPLRWGDWGDPEQGSPDLDQEVEGLQTSIQDSGIGTSLDSGSSHEANSSQSVTSTSEGQVATRNTSHAPEETTENEPASKRRRFNNMISKLSR